MGLPWPPPGDLSSPGFEPRSSALQAGYLLSEPPGMPNIFNLGIFIIFAIINYDEHPCGNLTITLGHISSSRS